MQMKLFFNKIIKYFSEVWGEVKPGEGKVSWPSMEEIKGSTWLVVVTVGIVAVYLGVIDMVVGYVVSWMMGIG